jgi:Ca2+-binding EF-hand superfamily protein
MPGGKSGAAPVKGTIVLRGGKGQYSGALVGNWEEDRGESLGGGPRAQPAGYETTVGAAGLESALGKTSHYGHAIRGTRSAERKIINYQPETVTGKPNSIQRLAYDPAMQDEFKEQFGSRSALKPPRELSPSELAAYRAVSTIDSASADRFVTEKIAFQSVGVPSQFRVNQRRALPNVPVPVQDLQQALIAAHGLHALHNLGRVFRLYNTDGDSVLSRKEFAALLEDMAVKVTRHQAETVFNYFDQDGSGAVDYREFIAGLSGQLSARRAAAVQRAWQQLSPDQHDVVALDEMIGALKAEGDGKLARDVRQKFRLSWDDLTLPVVTRDRFESYFVLLSPAVRDDDDFDQLLASMW